MATAGSRNGHSQQVIDPGGSQHPIEPLPVGDDGEFALEAEHFWPPEADVDRDPPSVPKLRRRRGRRSERNGSPQQGTNQAVDHPIEKNRDPHELFDIGPLTGSLSLADYELIEALALAAARTDDDAHAAQFVAAIVPLAVRLVPDAAPSLWPLLPELIVATAHLAKLLRRRPANRPLLALLPMLLRRTVAELRLRTLDGQPLTAEIASQTLTQQVAIVFPVRRGSGASAAANGARQRPKGEEASV